MFTNSRNVLISGSITHAQGNININHGSNAEQAGIDAVYGRAAPGAFHDSGERFDAPKCHPNTRVAIIEAILAWLDDLDPSSLYMWLHAPAGAGKSAIAQTLALLLAQRGRHSSSFFFSRTSNTGRSNDKGVVATLAYQLSKYVPETRPYISAAVLADPSIFDLALHPQCQALLVNPLLHASNALPCKEKRAPMLIIIDGLDECMGSNIQRNLLRDLTIALKSMQHNIPHKLLVASRSEVHLASFFNGRNISPMTKRIALNDTYHPDADIRHFLTDTFDDIKESHPLGGSLPPSWPSSEEIETLVKKSSGQFIYASVSLKYIRSHRHHPVERLKTILDLPRGHKDRPFAELDALYSHIFSVCEDTCMVLCVLRMALYSHFPPPHPNGLSHDIMSRVLRFSPEHIKLAFNDLISILEISDRGVIFLHASLPDFLLDETRSHELFIDQEQVNAYLAKSWIHLLQGTSYSLIRIFLKLIQLVDAPMYENSWRQTDLMDYILHHITRLDGCLSRPALISALCQVDFQDILSKIGNQESWIETGPYIQRIVPFFSWVLDELEIAPSDPGLVELFSKYEKWLTVSLEDFNYSGFDNAAGIDLTVFAMCHSNGDITGIKHRLNLMGLTDGWTIVASSGIEVPKLELAAECIFYKCLRYDESGIYQAFLNRYLHNSVLSKNYYLSETRYTDAALHCLQYIFQHSRDAAWSTDRLLFERETFYLSMYYASIFLPKAIGSTKLFRLCQSVTTSNMKGGPSTSSPESDSVTPDVHSQTIIRLNQEFDSLFKRGPTRLVGNGRPLFLPTFGIFQQEALDKWWTQSVDGVAREIGNYITRCGEMCAQDTPAPSGTLLPYDLVRSISGWFSI